MTQHEDRAKIEGLLQWLHPDNDDLGGRPLPSVGLRKEIQELLSKSVEEEHSIPTLRMQKTTLRSVAQTLELQELTLRDDKIQIILAKLNIQILLDIRDGINTMLKQLETIKPEDNTTSGSLE